jgi:hypothetical protein
MFNLSAYLGAVIARHLGHMTLAGAATCWIGMFFPGVILIFAAMPLWSYIRKYVMLGNRGVLLAAWGAPS